MFLLFSGDLFLRYDRFLDIMQEAPLFGYRKPTRIIGSFFYCFLLAGYAILAVGATWILHPIQGLIALLLCSCDVILLVVTGIFQQYLVYQVQKIRLQVTNSLLNVN
ncbi:uncharacterized protein LOC111376023 [Olea europaea var. sylvestris]|uniref:uncharacterized protein LOC111376023 n=1 Tax=Olea europaea var. sylvestris TaxID=158386 RepID=UPI000C1CDADE|nr:uncharacterized protein LOC111376023 [Olea europaea var. sylvestris]